MIKFENKKRLEKKSSKFKPLFPKCNLLLNLAAIKGYGIVNNTANSQDIYNYSDI